MVNRCSRWWIGRYAESAVNCFPVVYTAPSGVWLQLYNPMLQCLMLLGSSHSTGRSRLSRESVLFSPLLSLPTPLLQVYGYSLTTQSLMLLCSYHGTGHSCPRRENASVISSPSLPTTSWKPGAANLSAHQSSHHMRTILLRQRIWSPSGCRGLLYSACTPFTGA